jgi:uncharacterized protein (TIGR02231 family)
LSIGSVEARLAPVETKPDTAIEARLKTVRSDREGWQVTLDALEAKKAMMLHFSQSSPEKLSSDARPLAIGEWNAAWGVIGTAFAKVGDELRSARAKARDLDEEIKNLEAARGRPIQKTTPAREVTVEVEAGSALKGRVNLTYRINGAGWQPVYDARLATGGAGRKPSLELFRRAAVTQRTGEDWNDVALTVSTIRAGRSTAAPVVETQKLVFFEPPVIGAAGMPRAAPRSLAAPQQGSLDMAEKSVSSAALPPQPASEQQASIETGAYQASFKVQGRVSLTSDGATKTFLIAARALVPDLTVKTIPALDPSAYLEAHILNEDEAPLLPGAVALHRDGAFIGNGRIEMVPAGEAFDLGFGADERVKVARVPLRRKENEPNWLGQTKNDLREFKTTIKNLHDFPIKIVLVDQIPISENTAINVEQLPSTTQPTEKIVADKRGVMSWTYDYAPGETKEVRLGFRMKWPGDREVVLQNGAAIPLR